MCEPVLLRVLASSVRIADRAGQIVRDVMAGGQLGQSTLLSDFENLLFENYLVFFQELLRKLERMIFKQKPTGS